MFATYQRLRLHVSATPREVIAAARRKIRKDARRDPAQRDARHEFYREMLDYHAKARGLVSRFRL